jgi:hypothetical protein
MNTEQPTSSTTVNNDWYSLNSRGYVLNSEQVNTEQPEPDRWLRLIEQPQALNSEVNTEQGAIHSTVQWYQLAEQIASDIDAIHSLCYSAIQSDDLRPYVKKIMNILEGVRE